MHSTRNKGKQASTATKRADNTTARLATGPLATSADHLRACRDASRSHALTLYPLATVYQLDTLYPAERERLRKQFAQVVHLRGISGASFNLMTGQTTKQDTGCPDEMNFGCIAQVPTDERYSEKMLIRTRKGRKLVQRPAQQVTIELESAYQIEQAGPLFSDRASAMRLEGQHSESERIGIEQATAGHYERQAGQLIKIERQQPRIAVSRVIESMVDSRQASDYSHSIALQAAITRAAQIDRAHAGQPLNVPDRSFWDWRCTGYPQGFALSLHSLA